MSVSLTELADRLAATARILDKPMDAVLRQTVALGSITPAEARQIARAAGIQGW
jgi:hypothetical protein